MLQHFQHHAQAHLEAQAQVTSQAVSIIHNVCYYFPVVFLVLLAYFVVSMICTGRVVFLVRL